MKKSELKEMIKSAMLEGDNYYEDKVEETMPVDEAEEVDVEDNEEVDVDIEKVTDQIGNTITYFTRAHVSQVDESGVNEEEDYNSDVADISIDNPAEDAVVGLDESISRFKKLAGIIK